MAKRPDPELIDDDNPEWAAQEIARARPASELLLTLFGKDAAEEILGLPQPSALKAVRIQD